MVSHVLNHGLAWLPVFCDQTDYESFLQVVSHTHAMYGIEVLAYCLMGDHEHLCLRTPTGNLSRMRAM